MSLMSILVFQELKIQYLCMHIKYEKKQRQSFGGDEWWLR